MRVVAKIGTASITDSGGAIDVVAMAKLADEVAGLRAEGHEVIVVSSGAVGGASQNTWQPGTWRALRPQRRASGSTMVTLSTSPWNLQKR